MRPLMTALLVLASSFPIAGQDAAAPKHGEQIFRAIVRNYPQTQITWWGAASTALILPRTEWGRLPKADQVKLARYIEERADGRSWVIIIGDPIGKSDLTVDKKVVQSDDLWNKDDPCCRGTKASEFFGPPKPKGTKQSRSSGATQGTPLVEIVEDLVGYGHTSPNVLNRTYRYVGTSELGVTKFPVLRLHLVGNAASTCAGKPERELVDGHGGSPRSCVETSRCDVVHAWVLDDHPVFFVPVIVRILARCNGLTLAPAEFDRACQRAVIEAVKWRHDEAGIP